MASLSQASSPTAGSRIRSVLSRGLAFIGNLGLFVGIALLVGIGTSWYMIEIGSRLTTVSVGPWVSWPAAGSVDADPYTRARMVRHGSLPLTGTVARTFEARTDEDGQRLHSSCDYMVEGNAMDEGWWSITIYDDKGLLIANPADRYTFNSSTTARSADGTFLITLGRDARPGNWLPTAGAGRLSVVLTMLEAGDDVMQTGDERVLPMIRKVACR